MQLDPYGTIAFIPGIICILLAIQWGGATYPWSSARIIVLFVLGGLLIIAFVGIQFWQQENATVPPRIMNNRSIACAFLFVSVIAGSMMTMVYFIPLWFQAIKGVSAVRSGIDTLPMVLSLVTAVIASGIFVSKVGYYVPPMLLGPCFMAVGAGLLTTFKVDTPVAKWIGYQILYGIGLGMGMQQASMAAQAVLPQRDVAIGVSLMFFGQSLGGAVFVAIGEAVFANHLANALRGIPGLDAKAISQVGATQLRSFVKPSDLPTVLVDYNAALTKTFLVALVVGTLGIFPAMGMEWISVKKGHNAPGSKKDESVVSDEPKEV